MRLLIPAVLIAVLAPSVRAESRSVLILVTQPMDRTQITIHSDDKQDRRERVTTDEACKAIAGMKGWESVVSVYVVTESGVPRSVRKSLFEAIDANGALDLMYYGRETPPHLADYFLKPKSKGGAVPIEEPLIPSALNKVLPQVKAGMTPDEVKGVLAAAYPKLERQDGPWSGQTGYIGFRLDERHTILVSARSDVSGKTVMTDRVSVVDRTRKVRVDITLYDWSADGKKDVPKRVQGPEVGGDDGPEAVEKAGKRGAESAAADIKAGRAVVLYYGKPWSAAKTLVDDATGLTVEVVGGCAVSKAFAAEVEAYNAALRAWKGKK